MALYAYACDEHGEFEMRFAMGDAPTIHLCPTCRIPARRIIGNFQFQEDRYRLFRNPQDGSKFSYALGMEHPDNRTDYHAVTSALGCEPVTRGTMPNAWKEDREYAEHVRNGGERLPNDGHVPQKSDTTVLKQLRESNIRIPS